MVENYKITEENASGCCPECNHSWDKGDVFEVMKQNSPNVDDEIIMKNAEKNYKWTPETPRRFSHLLFIEPSDGDYEFDGSNGFYQCPNCQIAWDSATGDRTDKYKTMLDNHASMDKFMKELMEKNKNR